MEIIQFNLNDLEENGVEQDNNKSFYIIIQNIRWEMGYEKRFNY